MASLNPLTRELVFKIVFYGPGLGGKTTTLQYIHATTKPEHRGKMVSLATPTDRTLYFDFLPLRMPRVRGMSVRLQLFTVPGQVYYAATRKLVLSGADGIVFVADSQSGRMDANQESLEDLNANLAEHNKQLANVPHTFHWNKRDLSDLVPLDELDRRFNTHRAPSLGTVGTRGDGVFEGLERITRLVLRAYEAELPKSESQPVATLGAVGGGSEVSISEAIRGLAEAPLVTKVTPFAGLQVVRPEEAKPSAESEARMAASKTAPPEPRNSDRPSAGKLTAIPPAGAVPPPAGLITGRPPAVVLTENGAARALAESPAPEIAPAPSPSAAPPPPAVADPPTGRRSVLSAVAHPGAPTVAPPPGTSHFSMSELWPEMERETVRQTETLLGARDAHGAVLACDVLLTRILASAAGLTGPVDAPRDPGLVSLLLGLDGRRYLAFRSAVRAARQKEDVTLRDALDCFAFVIEARAARDAIRRGA